MVTISWFGRWFMILSTTFHTIYNYNIICIHIHDTYEKRKWLVMCEDKEYEMTELSRMTRVFFPQPHDGHGHATRVWHTGAIWSLAQVRAVSASRRLQKRRERSRPCLAGNLLSQGRTENHGVWRAWLRLFSPTTNLIELIYTYLSYIYIYICISVYV